MPAEIALRALLLQDSAVHSRVADRIYPLVIPKDVAERPALVTRVISNALKVKPVDERAPGGTHQTRVSVHVVTSSYPTLRELIHLVRNACHGRRGLIAGIRIGRISAELLGPTQRDDDMSLFSQSVDFLILHHDPDT